KMGKSKGNAVNPDAYDPDELRMYLMFLGPYQDGGDWNDKAIAGIRRFLGRIRRWLSEPGEDYIDLNDIRHQIDENLHDWKVNKVVSSLMKFYNANKDKKPSSRTVEAFLPIIRCFAPGFALHSESPAV